MAERARSLEQKNIGEKEWFMRGETDAGEDMPCFVPVCPLNRISTGLPCVLMVLFSRPVTYTLGLPSGLTLEALVWACVAELSKPRHM
jgi:hypothetical protein